MKINVKKISYEELDNIEVYKHKKPKKQSMFFNWLITTISNSTLKKVNFTNENIGMDKLTDTEPCLILMNHSSFTDLNIAFSLFHKRRFNIVMTDDGFVGKEGLMRAIGCIPTKKFITDVSLLKDMMYITSKLKTSILMYPEATYSFDGRCAVLPKSIGKCVKLLKVPVITCITSGSFLRDPLYNNLQIRDVNVKSVTKCLLTKEEVLAKSADEINEIICKEFTFDGFKEQIENKIVVDEPFRADYLNRILYKCPHCKEEGKMLGKGITIKCNNCGNEYELTEIGELKHINGEGKFNNVPDWYDYQKECVKQEIDNGMYSIDVDIEIYALKNMKNLYQIGDGHLHHDRDGFKLVGCDGKLEYTQGNKVSYSLYSDYYWYELGDMICIGNDSVRYYCIIKDGQDVASKARLAVQYLFNK